MKKIILLLLCSFLFIRSSPLLMFEDALQKWTNARLENDIDGRTRKIFMSNSHHLTNCQNEPKS